MEEVLMDKITSRIEKLCDGLNMDFIDPVIKYLKIDYCYYKKASFELTHLTLIIIELSIFCSLPTLELTNLCRLPSLHTFS